MGGIMETRQLGSTEMAVTPLSFGASSLGEEFRQVDLNEALRAARTALDLGLNLIDTSPYYGRGMSEMLLGRLLPEVPRDQFYLSRKPCRLYAARSRKAKCDTSALAAIR